MISSFSLFGTTTRSGAPASDPWQRLFLLVETAYAIEIPQNPTLIFLVIVADVFDSLLDHDVSKKLANSIHVRNSISFSSCSEVIHSKSFDVRGVIIL